MKLIGTFCFDTESGEVHFSTSLGNDFTSLTYFVKLLVSICFDNMNNEIAKKDKKIEEVENKKSEKEA